MEDTRRQGLYWQEGEMSSTTEEKSSVRNAKARPMVTTLVSNTRPVVKRCAHAEDGEHGRMSAPQDMYAPTW
jgi:hypothetical protein